MRGRHCITQRGHSYLPREHSDGDKRYASEHKRWVAYERRREWYTEDGEDDEREHAPSMSASWHPYERALLDRERFDREMGGVKGRLRGWTVWQCSGSEAKAGESGAGRRVGESRRAGGESRGGRIVMSLSSAAAQRGLSRPRAPPTDHVCKG